MTPAGGRDEQGRGDGMYEETVLTVNGIELAASDRKPSTQGRLR